MSDETIREYLTRPYNRVLTRENDGRFSAHVLEWPGCYGDGDTVEEANASLEASMRTWVSVMLEDGRPIPEPLARDYSGRLLVRMSKDTHRRVSVRAQAEGVSVNHLVCSFVEAGLARGKQRAGALSAAASDQLLFFASGVAQSGRVNVARHISEAATPPRSSLVVDDQGMWGIAREEAKASTAHALLRAGRKGAQRV